MARTPSYSGHSRGPQQSFITSWQRTGSEHPGVSRDSVHNGGRMWPERPSLSDHSDTANALITGCIQLNPHIKRRTLHWPCPINTRPLALALTWQAVIPLNPHHRHQALAIRAPATGALPQAMDRVTLVPALMPVPQRRLTRLRPIIPRTALLHHPTRRQGNYHPDLLVSPLHKSPLSITLMSGMTN